MTKVLLVIPNWNGQDSLGDCLDSLLAQSLPADILVVDNGSVDGSVAFIEQHYPSIILIKHDVNKGYAGGVNPGLQYAIDHDYTYVAPFNNDAVADPDWLQLLVAHLDHHRSVGAAACKILSADGSHLDSTGEFYTHWGLPFPRGRGETDHGQYDDQTDIFAASGNASLYRVKALKETGLLDEDFFAYYEDVDLSFRLQLYGWKVQFVPAARVNHATSTTGRKIHGFFTEMTMKNYPLLLWKNVPKPLMHTIFPRFFVVYISFFITALQRRQFKYALKGHMRFLRLFPRALRARRRIRKAAKVDATYIASMLVWDLPPDAHSWRGIRKLYWKITGKS